MDRSSQLVLIYGLNRRIGVSDLVCECSHGLGLTVVATLTVDRCCGHAVAMGDDLVAVIANQFISMPIWVMVGITAPSSFVVVVLC